MMLGECRLISETTALAFAIHWDFRNSSPFSNILDRSQEFEARVTAWRSNCGTGSEVSAGDESMRNAIYTAKGPVTSIHGP